MPNSIPGKVNDRLTHLLACLGEECGEVQQIVGKSLRFGLYNLHPKEKELNVAMLQKEVHDILAVYMMICEEEGLDPAINREAIAVKKARVNRYT